MQNFDSEIPVAVYKKDLIIYKTEGVSTLLNYIDRTEDEISEEEIEKIFDFIEDANLKNILIRDFLELEVCKNRNLSKSALVLCGSIIEALLMDQIFKDNNSSESQRIFNDIVRQKKPERIDLSPEKWWFAEIINVCEKLEIIGSESVREVWKLNDYRQIIHPMYEIREKKNITPELAQISYNVLVLIIKDLS